MRKPAVMIKNASDTMSYPSQPTHSITQPLLFRSLRGQLVSVREARPADAARLVELLRGLSERTLQFRYMHPRSMPPGTAWNEAARMAQARAPEHTTLLATLGPNGQGEVVPAAELARDPHNLASGEIALVVRDDVQQQKIGSFLLWRLIRVAQRDGITRLSANMLAENRAMLRLVVGLGLPYSASTRYGETEVQISLPAMPRAPSAQGLGAGK